MTLQSIIHRVQAPALRDREASTGVLEVAPNLMPCRPVWGRALEGAEQGGVAERLPKHTSHEAPGVPNRAREGGAPSDGGLMFGRAQWAQESGPGSDKSRREPSGGSGEFDELALELCLRRVDVCGQALGEAAQALGPVISRGTTHWSNCSAVSRPSSSAASLSVVPST